MSRYQRWKGRAELILEEYRATKRLLREIEEDAIFASRSTETTFHKSVPAKPVERSVVQMDDKTVRVMREEVAAVEHMLATISRTELGERKVELLRRAYIDGSCGLIVAADLLGVHRSTAGRWKRQALEILAIDLCWIR